MDGIDSKDSSSAAMDTSEPHMQQQSFQHLGLFDMDISGDSMGAAAAATSTATATAGGGGNFPFPLTDQSSLFNFHTPSGLGFDSFYADVGSSTGGGLMGSGFDFPSAARQAEGMTVSNAGAGAGAGAGILAMDIALLNS
ncbi:hypothetical protein J3B02_003865, partial [Coemansia erecta]